MVGVAVRTGYLAVTAHLRRARALWLPATVFLILSAGATAISVWILGLGIGLSGAQDVAAHDEPLFVDPLYRPALIYAGIACVLATACAAAAALSHSRRSTSAHPSTQERE